MAGSPEGVSNVGSLLPPKRSSGPNRFYSPQPGDVQVLAGGGSDAQVITFARTHMTQTMDGVALVLTEEPAHRDTATCRHTGTHGRSRRGQGAGTAPARVRSLCRAPKVCSPSGRGCCWEKGAGTQSTTDREARPHMPHLELQRELLGETLQQEPSSALCWAWWAGAAMKGRPLARLEATEGCVWGGGTGGGERGEGELGRASPSDGEKG